MSTQDIRYSFGPVPSRRLGRSLGINNIPVKNCSYACCYCQVGQTTAMTADRREFYPPGVVIDDVLNRVAAAREAGEQIDYLTFVPDGEPTLDINLGHEIAELQRTGIPVAVITNGSLLAREDVREDLSRADWVSLKFDAVRESTWRRINRPVRTINLADVLVGARDFAAGYSGMLVTETMLVQDFNTSEDDLRETAEFIRSVDPAIAYLSIPTRPPVDASVRGPEHEVLNQAFQVFGQSVPQVEYLIGYEGDEFASTGDIVRDLLSITAVHPMRRNALEQFLENHGGSWETVDGLLSRGDLVETAYRGNLYYLRKPRQPATG